MSTPQQVSTSERRIDLDWVRILAFGLLIFYHVGMLYVSWGFHIKSEHRLTWLEPAMLVLNPWRLSLLFLVSGVASRFMLGKYRLAAFARARSVRLLDPADLRHARDRAAAILSPDRREPRLSRRFCRFLSSIIIWRSARSSVRTPASRSRPGTISGSWSISGSTPWPWPACCRVWPTAADWIGERLAAVLAGPWLLVLPCLLLRSLAAVSRRRSSRRRMRCSATGTTTRTTRPRS